MVVPKGMTRAEALVEATAPTTDKKRALVSSVALMATPMAQAKVEPTEKW
jgi:hypothetical protein